MFDPYRRVLGVPGALLFTVTGLVARLPISMVSLGITLLVQGVTGSFGLAGAVTAVFVTTQALFAVVQGRLVDRVGQGRVLTVVAVLWGLALSVTTVSVTAGWPMWTTYLAAAVAGGALPSVGACVRARWAHVLADRPGEVSVAYAFEGVTDEAVFIIGPILVTVLATTFHPASGLVVALVAGVIGTLGFAAQRGTEPPVHAAAHPDGARISVPWRILAPVTVVAACLGVLFGAAEVITVAFTEERGVKAWSGLLLAIWALGSLVAGVATGAIHWKQGPAVRVRVGSIGMALAMVPLTFIDSVWLMGCWLFVAGFAISPTLISTMALLERAVPRARLTESMTIMYTGLLGGVAMGAAVSGIVIDAHGASVAYSVPLAAGILAAVTAQLVRGTGASPTRVISVVG